jgi:hypothetical protein
MLFVPVFSCRLQRCAALVCTARARQALGMSAVVVPDVGDEHGGAAPNQLMKSQEHLPADSNHLQAADGFVSDHAWYVWSSEAYQYVRDSWVSRVVILMGSTSSHFSGSRAGVAVCTVLVSNRCHHLTLLVGLSFRPACGGA